MKDLISRKKAAEILGISTHTLDLARNNGEIAYIQYVNRGSIFFRMEDLQDYMARCTRRARPVEHHGTYRRVRNR